VGGGGATQNPAFPRGEGMCVVAALTLPMACLPPFDSVKEGLVVVVVVVVMVMMMV